MSVRISTPRMTTEPSIRLWEERIFGLINSLTGPLTVLMAPRPSRELPPSQVPANCAVLRILAQTRKNVQPVGELGDRNGRNRGMRDRRVPRVFELTAVVSLSNDPGTTCLKE